MAQTNVLKKYLDAGVSFTNLTQSKAEALVKELVKVGEVQTEARPRTGTPARSDDDRISLRPARRTTPRPEPVVGVPRADGLVRVRLGSTLSQALRTRICAVVAPVRTSTTLIQLAGSL